MMKNLVTTLKTEIPDDFMDKHEIIQELQNILKMNLSQDETYTLFFDTAQTYLENHHYMWVKDVLSLFDCPSFLNLDNTLKVG